MNTIKIQLTPRQLNTIAYTFNGLKTIHPKTKEERTARSILLELSLKFQKKNLEVTQKDNLFSSKKKAAFTLKYHEAFYLEYYLNLIHNFPLSEYDQNCVNFIKSTLNQKLA